MLLNNILYVNAMLPHPSSDDTDVDTLRQIETNASILCGFRT